MSIQDSSGFKKAQAAFEDAADFSNDAIGTIQKSYLQATQAVLSGYSEVVQKAIDYCDSASEKSATKAHEGK